MRLVLFTLMFTRNKYRATKTADGYGSKLESAVGQILLAKERLGELSDIKRQQTVRLTEAQITYRADFSYTETITGKTVWVEAKGVELERWRMIKKLWGHYGPGRLEIYKGNYRAPKLVETIEP